MQNENMNILLVEDNPADAVLFMELLEEGGHGDIKVTHVERLHKALELIQRLQPAAILLDLTLPDSYGLETFTKIQQTGPDIPILVLTGNDDESLAMEAVDKGAADFLFKGDMHCRLLIRSIQYAIRRKRNEAERERLIGELQDALSEVKRLSGLLPICASCKSIRDDKGYWQQLEKYMGEHSAVQFSHGICPDCAHKLYPELFKNKDKGKVKAEGK
jgi:CheY-like chemotaxis protein